MLNQSQYFSAGLEDDLKSSTLNLRTKISNSPSGKFESQNFETSTLNCSFDEGGQSGHVQAVWEASVKYLQSSLAETSISQKGLNDQSLYEFPESPNGNQMTVEELVMRNGCLNVHQRFLLMKKLKNSSEIKDFLEGLSECFNKNIFHEVAYLIFKILEQKSEKLSSDPIQTQNQGFSLPRFNCLSQLDNASPSEVSGISYSNNRQKKTKDEVIKEAEKCSELIGSEIYFDSKIMLLSLRETKRQVRNSALDGSSFLEFFKVLTKSVYLSIEGFFSRCLDNESIFGDFELESEFEFEINNILEENNENAFENSQSKKNELARTFDQLMGEDDDDMRILFSVEKKRKFD